jgi:hypothetical protein
MTNNTNPPGLDRLTLETRFGKVWNEEEFARDFHVGAIIGTSMVVVQRSDGQVGKITYQNQPRFYFNFEPTNPA